MAQRCEPSALAFHVKRPPAIVLRPPRLTDPPLRQPHAGPALRHTHDEADRRSRFHVKPPKRIRRTKPRACSACGRRPPIHRRQMTSRDGPVLRISRPMGRKDPFDQAAFCRHQGRPLGERLGPRCSPGSAPSSAGAISFAERREPLLRKPYLARPSPARDVPTRSPFLPLPYPPRASCRNRAGRSGGRRHRGIRVAASPIGGVGLSYNLGGDDVPIIRRTSRRQPGPPSPHGSPPGNLCRNRYGARARIPGRAGVSVSERPNQPVWEKLALAWPPIEARGSLTFHPNQRDTHVPRETQETPGTYQ